MTEDTLILAALLAGFILGVACGWMARSLW
jgi:hypothetical protein